MSSSSPSVKKQQDNNNNNQEEEDKTNRRAGGQTNEASKQTMMMIRAGEDNQAASRTTALAAATDDDEGDGQDEEEEEEEVELISSSSSKVDSQESASQSDQDDEDVTSICSCCGCTSAAAAAATATNLELSPTSGQPEPSSASARPPVSPSRRADHRLGSVGCISGGPNSGASSKRGSRSSCTALEHRNSTASTCGHHLAGSPSTGHSNCCSPNKSRRPSSGRTKTAASGKQSAEAQTTTTTDCDESRNKSTRAPDESDGLHQDDQQEQQQQQQLDQHNTKTDVVSQETDKQPALTDNQAAEREAALIKRRYVLTELIETERDYVNDLGKLVEGYLEEIRRQLVDCGVDDILTTGVVPSSSSGVASTQEEQPNGDSSTTTTASQPDKQATDTKVDSSGCQESATTTTTTTTTTTSELKPKLPEALMDGKHKIIFGNVEAIYEFHRDYFLAELERCLEEPAKLGLLFKRYERRLNMYVVYCQNKPRSEAIVSDHLDSYFEVSLTFWNVIKSRLAFSCLSLGFEYSSSTWRGLPSPSPARPGSAPTCSSSFHFRSTTRCH